MVGKMLWLIVALKLASPLALLEHDARAQSYASAIYLAPTTADHYAAARQVEWSIANTLHATIEYTDDLPDGVAGRTLVQTRAIQIEKDLSWDARLQVLAHEAGHILSPSPIEDYADRETFADAVSYLVCRHFGWAPTGTYAQYLAGRKNGLHILHDYRTEIEWAARVIAGE
jgi:hypothetical protein